MDEMIVNKDMIVDGLRAMGLSAGAKVLVHSSLSSFGYVQGGADDVIDALLEVVGEEGTVIVPTLTGSELYSVDNPPVFDLEDSPCWTGKIPETFRKRKGAIRSVHPTHSVAAIGRDAAAITEDHEKSLSPCDEFSPYAKLAGYDDGYVLLIGVDLERATILHHVEEAAKAEYHLQEELVNAEIIVGGEVNHREILIHKYGTPRNFNVIEKDLVLKGIEKLGKIGNSKLRLIKAKEMVEFAIDAIQKDPELFVLKEEE